MDLVDQMRLAIPAEIRQAQRVQQGRERVLAQAQEEARRLTKEAADKASLLVDDQALTQNARTRSEEIIARALEESTTLRREADGYVLETLQTLQTQLVVIQTQVQNGIALLTQSQQPEPDASHPGAEAGYDE